MIYYFLIGCSGIILSSLLLFFRQRFFLTLEHTLGLSNAVLSQEEELIKQKKLIRALKKMLSSLILAIGIIGLIVVLTALPVCLYIKYHSLELQDLDLSSIRFIAALSIGSILPFLIKRKPPSEDYSEASILFHKLILNNNNISRKLFSFDHKFKKGEKINDNELFLIVSGLARAGTTSLTDQLFKAGAFSSLDYSNMPLLLAPNLWKKMYNPKKGKLKERKHGDKMMFGLNTIEALEEYFFKVFLNDEFISESYLEKHDVSEEVYKNYITYQSLIRKDNGSIYLSKNNNMILRYEALRAMNSKFKIVFLFRKPEEHAFSLLNQHQRFSEFQNDNAFMQTYLNWLGHHEFGNNQKIFNFYDEDIYIQHDKNTLDYWLSIWLNYYNYLIQMNDSNYMLIEYQDYLSSPKKVLEYIEGEMNGSFDYSNIEPFSNTKQIDTSNCDTKLLQETAELYTKLKERKLQF